MLNCGAHDHATHSHCPRPLHPFTNIGQISMKALSLPPLAACFRKKHRMHKKQARKLFRIIFALCCAARSLGVKPGQNYPDFLSPCHALSVPVSRGLPLSPRPQNATGVAKNALVICHAVFVPMSRGFCPRVTRFLSLCHAVSSPPPPRPTRRGPQGSCTTAHRESNSENSACVVLVCMRFFGSIPPRSETRLPSWRSAHCL